jgi:hypothetical protein
MSEIDPSYVLILRDALSNFCREASVFISEQGVEAKPNSKAETEHTTYANPESILNAWSAAQILIEFTGDHVSAFVKLLDPTKPIEVSAVWTTVRSTFENSGLASWLLDPTITPKERSGRMLALRYEGIEEQIKYARVMDDDAANIAAMEARLDEIEQGAINEGFARREKDGKRTGVAVPMPGATKIIRDIHDEEGNYRLLSAVAHGHFWALKNLNFIPASAPDVTISGVDMHALQKHVYVDAITVFGTSVMQCFARPLWNQCRYFGWNENGLEELFEKVADRMGLNNPLRFWRPAENRKS